MRIGFINSTSTRWNADASEMTSSSPSKFLIVKFTLTHLISSSAHLEPGYEGTQTDYCKEQTVFDACAVPLFLVSLNTGKNCRHLYSFHPQCLSSNVPWTVNDSRFSCTTIVNSVPLHRDCKPGLLMFPLSPNTDLHMWLFLALVANPTTYQ